MDAIDDLIQRLRKLSACQVSDGLGAVGLARDGMLGIHAMEPAQRVVGRAFTVRCRPAVEAVGARIEYLQDLSPGDVVVISNQGRLDCSVWGGQRTVAAIQRGAVGTVVDGAYRDIEEHRQLGYPVFGRAATIVGSMGYASPVATNEVLLIGGILVRPGDYVVGDGSGVAVIPHERVADVLDAAESITAEEDRISAAVQAGEDFTSFRKLVRDAR
jgi:regulator of RNase E activity RraA